MNPRVVQVYPLAHFQLKLEFQNGEIRRFDLTPYLSIGVFRELADPVLFETVKANLGSISWQNGQDLCLDTLYIDSLKM